MEERSILTVIAIRDRATARDSFIFMPLEKVLTSFLLVVIVVSILLSSIVFSFSAFHFTNPFLRTLVHLALLPVVVGITWELNRYVGGHDNLICRAVRRPGMAIQRWTTFEPDDSMIEVGITALKLVLPEVKGEDAW